MNHRLCIKLHVTVKYPFKVAFPVVKIPSMAVSLYNVILLVVGHPMYEKPLTVKYTLRSN